MTVVSLIILLKRIDGFSEFTLLTLPHFFLNIPVRLVVSYSYRDVQRIDQHLFLVIPSLLAVFLFLWKPIVSSVTLLVISTNLLYS